MAFGLDSADENRLALQGQCLYCRNPAWSRGFFSLVDLGQLLEKFEPGEEHMAHCPSRRSAPGDRLVDTIQEIVEGILESR